MGAAATFFSCSRVQAYVLPTKSSTRAPAASLSQSVRLYNSVSHGVVSPSVRALSGHVCRKSTRMLMRIPRRHSTSLMCVTGTGSGSEKGNLEEDGRGNTEVQEDPNQPIYMPEIRSSPSTASIPPQDADGIEVRMELLVRRVKSQELRFLRLVYIMVRVAHDRVFASSVARYRA